MRIRPPPTSIVNELFTWLIMAFLLVILAVFLLYPVVDICRLSFFKDGSSP